MKSTPRNHQQEDIAQTVKELGRRLRTSRKAQGFTQAHMAALIGVSIPTYQHLESGKGTSALWVWVAACRLLGLRP